MPRKFVAAGETGLASWSSFIDWKVNDEEAGPLGVIHAVDDSEKKTEDRLIKGCQSRVWLDAEMRDGRLWFTADSDAIITKGIISLLIRVYDGRSAAEIAADNFDFVEKIGLRENLSPTRANGLNSMIETIRKEAERNV